MCTYRFVLFAACALSAIWSVALAWQEETTKEVQPAPPVAVSFVGERLVYNIKWDPPWYLFFLPAMEAGEISVQLADEAEYKGEKVLKILFEAHSSGTLARMAGLKVEDEFVYFTEPKTFCTVGASRKIREGKRKRQIDIEYLRETRQLHFREIDESVVPPKLKKDEIKDNIPSCVQDPLSALYFFRMSQLQKGYDQTFVIGHDDKINEVKTHVEIKESLVTPAGKFSAWRVNVLALMGGLFKEGGQFRIWFSADEKKMPVQFEVKVRLGRVLGKLKLVKN